MKETAEGLVEKYTRSELIDLARDRGIYVSKSKNYPNKMSIAEAIVKAKKGAEKAPVREVAFKKPKAGAKGVFAKKAAIKAQKETNDRAVSQFNDNVEGLQEDMIELQKDMGDRIVEFYQKVNVMGESIEKKKRMDAKAIGQFHSGVADLQDDICEAAKDLASGIETFNFSVKTLNKNIDDRVLDINRRAIGIQKNIGEMKRKNANAARTMNRNAVQSLNKNVRNMRRDTAGVKSRMNAGVRNMNAGTDMLVGDINRLVGDVCGFVKEFYYG